MTLPPKPQYAITASDRVEGVRVGAKVIYSLVRTNIVSSADGASPGIEESEDAITGEYTLGHPYTEDRVVHPSVRWTIVPEASFELGRAGEFDGFPGLFATDDYVVAVEWQRPGVHRVRCVIESSPAWGDRPSVVDFRQLVLTEQEDADQFAEEWAAHRWVAGYGDAARDSAITSPERAAMDIFQTLEVAEQLERLHPTTDFDAKRSYQRMREQQTKIASALYDRLLAVNANDHQRHAILARHRSPIDNVELKVFAAIGREPRPSSGDQVADEERARVQIVDWTDATDRTYAGTYGSARADVANALARALLRWKTNSHYPDGEVRFELPPAVAEILGAGVTSGRLEPEVVRELHDELGLDLAGFQSGLHLEGGFRTAGPIDVAEILDHVALASALVAVAATLAAPVPGSRVVAALLWTSAVSGAGASTVRIATRHGRGISDPTATAIDALGLVSSLLMIPGATAVWRQGAKVAIREAAVFGSGTKLLKMSLVGQVVADGLQGALIGKEAYDAIHGVLADGSKDPMSRLSEVAKLMAQLVAVGTLVVVGAKANVDDLARLRTGDDAGLRRLADPDAELDLTDGAGSPGDTRHGRHADIADIDPPADGRMMRSRAELTPAARAALGELDAAQGAAVRRMLDADGIGANLLLARFGRKALAVADDFVAVWKRWDELGLPTAWLRQYHKHTNLHGVRYFAKLPKTAAGRDEMIAGGWACHREEHFHDLYPAAGHSVARHGPHLPDGPGEALEARVKTGYAADVALHERDVPGGGREYAWEHVAAPSGRSSRFLSFRDWLEAHDSALFALRTDFPGSGVEQFKGPIEAKGKEFPIAAGYLRFRDVDDPTKTIHRSLGEAYEGVKDGTEYRVRFRRADGHEYMDHIYPSTLRVRREEVDHIYATLGWTGREWILINMYPSKLPKPTTVVKLDKKPVPGKSTI
jgi:hypothetical protein